MFNPQGPFSGGVSQPPQGSFFAPAASRPPGPQQGFQPGQPNQPNQPQQFQTQFEDAHWRHKRIESLNPQTQNAFFNIQQEIDSNESLLKQSESSLNQLSELQVSLRARSHQLFGTAKKIISRQRRLQAAIEIRKRFETNVARYVREFIKVCEQVNGADYLHKVPAPAGFLSDMLNNAEETLDQIEVNVKEMEELFAAETPTPDFGMLVQTLMLMQNKFKVVAAMAYEMHEKVENLSRKLKGVDLEEVVMKDETEEYVRRAEQDVYSGTWEIDPSSNTLLFNQKQKPQQKLGYSQLRDAIVGKVGHFQGPVIRR